MNNLFNTNGCTSGLELGLRLFLFQELTEHDISNARKYKKYKEIQLFPCSDKPKMRFFLLIHVKMPTIVGILTSMSRKKFMHN